MVPYLSILRRLELFKTCERLSCDKLFEVYIILEVHKFAGVPRVIEAIDCTHVPIKAPSDHPEQFVNRHRYMSINMQMVVNHRGSITNISARWPGSCHNSRILQETFLQDPIESPALGKYYLIDDSGYANQLHLLMPYTEPQINDEKEIL